MRNYNGQDLLTPHPETDTIAHMHSHARDAGKNAGDQPQEIWLDHLHTSGQIFLLLIACLLIFFLILIAGVESGILSGTLVLSIWFLLAVGWWIIYRLLYRVIAPRNQSHTSR